jgi:hypothetical protein
MRWLHIALIGIALGTMCGCDHEERISRLEKENKDLRAEVDKTRDTVADYDLQAKCSKDARTWFNESWTRDKDTLLLDFSNHYNREKNKCFILVEYHYNAGVSGSWMNDITLWDVYENAKYGTFSDHHYVSFSKDGGPAEQLIGCEVQSKKCSTADEFYNLIQPYLNN